MTTLVFLLEELSAKALLQGLVPRLLGDSVKPIYIVFEGKQDLEKHLARKLRGWRAPASRFVVMRDQDASNCHDVKRKLEEIVATSGRHALIRIACRDLESWVAGDLRAVAQAFGEASVANHSSKAKFRDPDALQKPVNELRRLVPDYQKIDGARRLGGLLHPDTNTSASFRVFCSGLRRLMEGR